MTFEPINIKLIATESNEDELSKLIEMMLGCLMNYDNNQDYIQAMSELEENTQLTLKLLIEQVIIFINL